MDINTLRGLSTVFVMIAFFAVCWWAFAPSRKRRFEDDANLPFADEPSEGELSNSQQQLQSSTDTDKVSDVRQD